GIAHDFNNLLCGILGSAELVLMDMDDSSPAREDLETIRQTSRRASELCKQLLAYSGKGRFVVEPLNLTDIVTGMSSLLQLSVTKNVVLRSDLAADLVPIDADPAQIQQIVLNLIINASEAIDDRSGEVSLTTGMRDLDSQGVSGMLLGDTIEPGPYVYLEVDDTGCGMDEETTAHMFDPFFSTKFTGRGLGLAATLGILKGHGGAIDVKTTPGKGSTVTIYFPTGSRPAPTTCPLPSPDGWQGSGTALLVDDEMTVRIVGKRMLETLGFDVLTAEDGRAGVQVFEEHADDIQLLLLDMTMPRLNGADTFRHIRALKRDTPVLLISGYDEDEAIARFTEKGLAGFVHKPFTIATLRDSVRAAVEGGGRDDS
ncbi:MAG: response regulator, partial [Kiritimatiellia bacterium]|nr:response regulator [Kiritimatiellia bacterium]